MADIYDTIVDGTSIDTAMASSGSVLIKSGTYSSDATITIDQNNMKVDVEPGTTINANTGGIVISGNNCEIYFGPGCTVDNNASPSALSITISGTDCSLRFKNGCTVGNISIAAAGDRTFLCGGGWSTVIESVDCDSDDCIVQFASWDSKSNATSLDSIQGGIFSSRFQVKFNKVINSDSTSIELNGSDSLCLGNVSLASDVGSSIFLQNSGDRCRVIGNYISGGRSIGLGSAAEDALVAANYVSNAITVNASTTDAIITGNRAVTITDDSSTSTVLYNDLGTASCAVTGTLQSIGATESEIQSGGATLILTLTNASWRNESAAVLATNFQALLTGDQDGNNSGWDDQKATILASGSVVRTSSTVMTITLAAASGYDILADETITLADLDGTVLESESTITPNDTSFEVLNMEHGQIYINDGSTGQTTNATPGTFDVMTGWNTAAGVDGLSSTNITPAKASNKITIGTTGIYYVALSCSFAGTGNSTFDLKVYWNGVAQDQLHLERKIGSGGDVGDTHVSGYLDVTSAATDMDVRVASDGASDTFTPQQGSLSALRVAST